MAQDSSHIEVVLSKLLKRLDADRSSVAKEIPELFVRSNGREGVIDGNRIIQTLIRFYGPREAHKLEGLFQKVQNSEFSRYFNEILTFLAAMRDAKARFFKWQTREMH